VTPVEALERIAELLIRGRAPVYRAQAFRRAAREIARVDDAELRFLADNGRLQELPGVGDKTAAVIVEALDGKTPEYLQKLLATADDHTDAGEALRVQLKGDLHVHSDWSDGSAPIEEMMLAAKELGHEYCALTDHSPRLKVANGLSAERLRKQLAVIDELRDMVAPMRILTGIEVDILEDGSLDQEPELLERLDVVVASVHSKLSMDAPSMTRRMIKAVTNPHADVLGHCTGRLVTGGRGIRPESKFDAEKVFTACRDAGTAVEINSRPERRDPPTRLLNLALEIGCLFSIDTDSHAPGQLEFLGYGAQRALDAGVPTERIVNAWSAEKLLEWTTN
jgi:putative hydrolase